MLLKKIKEFNLKHFSRSIFKNNFDKDQSSINKKYFDIFNKDVDTTF